MPNTDFTVTIKRIIVKASNISNKSSLYIGIIKNRKNNDGTNDNSLGTLFFINKSSKALAVDFAILLKNDNIIILPIKLIIKTINTIDMKISPEANRFEKPFGTP